MTLVVACNPRTLHETLVLTLYPTGQTLAQVLVPTACALKHANTPLNQAEAARGAVAFIVQHYSSLL